MRWNFSAAACSTMALSFLFCLTPLTFAGTVKKNILQDVTLEGGRQGHAVGFVDVDGDGIDDKIVGAPYATVSAKLGAALVYAGSASGEFSSTPAMILSGDDNYGFSFVNLGDVDGDGKEDFAVGALNGDGPDVSLSGSVTIFQGGRNRNYDKGGGKVIAKLAGEGPLDKFGLSLAAGDLNNDGLQDLIVGAPFNTNDPAVYQGGAVYIFFAPDFTQRVSLHASATNKGLGGRAAAGDINGDNRADLCISVSGKVLCYYGAPEFTPTTDSPDVTITSSSAGFGKALAVTEDLDGDAYGDLVIGAPNAVVNGNRDTGSIYVVKGGTGSRTINLNAASPDLIVRLDGEALFDRFGSSIVIIADADGGQQPDFAVGAPMANLNSFSQLTGRVYLLCGEDICGAMTLANATVFAGVARDQGYGTSLAVAADSHLLIGAPRSDSDTGWVNLVDLATGQAVPGGSSGGATGSGDECY